MRNQILILVALLLSAIAVASCATQVPPTITIHPQIALDPDAALFVTSNRERPRVVRALGDAGLKVANESQNAGYTLQVRVGRTRGRADCGNNANVAYILKAAGRNAMVIKGRGRTGECQPNILDGMSQELAWAFRSGGQ